MNKLVFIILFCIIQRRIGLDKSFRYLNKDRKTEENIPNPLDEVKIPITQEELDEDDKKVKAQIKKEEKEEPLDYYDTPPYSTYPIFDKNMTAVPSLAILPTTVGSVYLMRQGHEYRIDHYYDFLNPAIPLAGLYAHPSVIALPNYYQRQLFIETCGNKLDLEGFYYMMSILNAHVHQSYIVDSYPNPVSEFPFFFKDRPVPSMFRYARVEKIPKPDPDMIIKSTDKGVTEHIDRYEIYLHRRYTMIEELKRLRHLNFGPFMNEMPSVPGALLDAIKAADLLKKKPPGLLGKGIGSKGLKIPKVNPAVLAALLAAAALLASKKKKAAAAAAVAAKAAEDSKHFKNITDTVEVKTDKDKIDESEEIDEEETEKKDEQEAEKTDDKSDKSVDKEGTSHFKGIGKGDGKHYTIKSFPHLSPFFRAVVKEFNRRHPKVKKSQDLRMPLPFFKKIAHYYAVEEKRHQKEKKMKRRKKPHKIDKSHKELTMPSELFTRIISFYDEQKNKEKAIKKKPVVKKHKTEELQMPPELFSEIALAYEKKKIKDIQFPKKRKLKLLSRMSKKQRNMIKIKSQYKQKAYKHNIRKNKTNKRSEHSIEKETLKLPASFFEEIVKVYAERKEKRKKAKKERKLLDNSFDICLATTQAKASDYYVPQIELIENVDPQIPKLVKTYYYEDDLDIYVFSIRSYHLRVNWLVVPLPDIMLQQWLSLIRNVKKYHAMGLLVINVMIDQVCYVAPGELTQLMICDTSGMMLANQPDRIKYISRFVAPEIMKDIQMNKNSFPYPKNRLVSYGYPVDVYSLGFFFLRHVVGEDIYTRNNTYTNQECYTRKCYKEFIDLLETQRMTNLGLDPMENDKIKILETVISKRKYYEWAMFDLAKTMIAYDDYLRPDLNVVEAGFTSMIGSDAKLANELAAKLVLEKEKKAKEEEEEKEEQEESTDNTNTATVSARALNSENEERRIEDLIKEYEIQKKQRSKGKFIQDGWG